MRLFQISGPAWLGSAHFDITAKVPPGATKEQLNLMLQNLLKQRFRVQFHHETKLFSAYDLVVDRRGLKLRQSDPEKAPLAQNATPSMALMGVKNYGGIIPQPGGLMIVGTGLPIRNLASMLESQLSDVPVLDKTGLTGFYDFQFEFASNDVATDSSLPSVFAAVEDECGLKLESVKAPFDILIIDRIDNVPTEN